MRHFALLLVLAAGCAPREDKRTYQSTRMEVQPGLTVGDPSLARTSGDLEPYSGETVTLTGTFDRLDGSHGIIRLDSGLKVYIPHFDLFARGDDWFRHVGERVAAVGRLHTYTKNIDGYRGPSLQIEEFSRLSE